MSTLLRYFKKKMQPLKKCVANNPSPVTDDSLVKQAQLERDSKGIGKKSNKRLFNLKIKRSIIANLNEYLKEAKSTEDLQSGELQHDFLSVNQSILGHDKDGKFQALNTDTILFTTPVSSNTSSSHYLSTLSKNNTRIVYGESNFALSSDDGDFFESTHSNLNRNRARSSTYDPEGFVFESVSNTSPATDVSNQSMVTYNTKYANSNISDDDGLMSNSMLHQPSLSISNSMQQSTPYCEHLTRFRNSKIEKPLIRKSHTTNFDVVQKNDEQFKTESKAKADFQNEASKKCRRSNTTYTVTGNRKPNTKIIEYFNNLELSKPTKRKASAQKNTELDRDDSKKAKSNIYSDIERLQDAFFSDDSSLQNTSIVSNNIKNTNGALLSYLEPVTPPTSVTDSSRAESTQEKSELSDLSSQTPLLKAKHTNQLSINNSMEKMRRSLSMPGLSEHSLIAFANVSKISMIKEAEISSSIKESTQKIDDTQSSTTATLVSTSNKDLTNHSFGCGEFVRGEPNTRLSKNIKQMFKNVIKQQMHALNSLEKFYEAQVARLAADRERSLKENPENKEHIEEYYSNQLKMLEERVQSNLKVLSENKNTRNSPFKPKQAVEAKPAETQEKQAKKVLTHRISQLMLLKQIQMQQSQPQIVCNQQNMPRALNGLKTNLISKNSLLPSKTVRSVSQLARVESDEAKHFTYVNESQLKETVFRRHLSLPFKQCRHKPIAGNFDILNRSDKTNLNLKRSPKISTLAHSTSRVKYNKQFGTINATSSPLNSVSNESTASGQVKSSFQYQKNMAKRFSTSTENVSQLRKSTSDITDESCSIIKSIGNDSSLNKLEASTVLSGSRFAQIRRQNKSVSSVKSDQFLFQTEANPAANQNEDADKSQFSSYLKHNMLFATNVLETHNHGVKYVTPRLSDGHIQYRIKMAVKNDLKQGNQFVSNPLRATQSNIQLSQKNNVTYAIETEV